MNEDEDPIYEENSKWYFRSKLLTQVFGPYETEIIARINLGEYIKYLEGQHHEFDPGNHRL